VFVPVSRNKKEAIPHSIFQGDYITFM